MGMTLISLKLFTCFLTPVSCNLTTMLSLLRRRPDSFVLCGLALVCAVVFWPLLSGQTLYYGDLQLYFQPMATFWASHLAQGRVPLWNAGILGGAPFVGNPQMWILYPSALLFLVFSPLKALAFSMVIHFWLGGAFFYGFARRGTLNLRPLAALLGACVWMLCGWVVAKAQFPNMLQALAWVPAVLWAGEAVAARADARSVLVLALVLALQLLAAHAQISLFSGYMLLVYAFYRWRMTPQRPSGWRVAASLVGALMLAGLLTLGQTLPVWEALGATVRQKLGLFDASRFALVPQALATLIAPHLYGNPMKGVWNYPVNSLINIWETVGYLGLVPLVLAIVAVKNEPRARFWTAWALGFLWLSMGVFGGLYVAAFYLLPGVARFHDAARFLVGYSLGGALMAALGANWLLSYARNGALWAGLALVLTLLDLGVFARRFYPTLPLTLAQSSAPAWGRDEFLEARQGRILTLRTDLLWGMYQPIRDMRPNDRDNTRRFFALVPPNRQLMNGWLAESGYEPLYDRATKARIAALHLNLSAAEFPPPLAGQLGRNSVRLLQIPRAAPWPNTPDWTLVDASEPPVDGRRVFTYRNEKCLPRARWHNYNGLWQRARIIRETSNSIELQVPTVARQIELADSMRPGWHVALDGKPMPIETTAEGWRRVDVPRVDMPVASGKQSRRVRFEYAPMVWKFGIFVSLCALGFVATGLAATRAHKP